MNPDASPDDPQTLFYDLDYPWPEDEVYAQALADPFIQSPVKADIDLLVELASKTGGPILDFCCGTGRLSIPLARAGHDVTAIDISAPQIARFQERLAQEPDEVRARIAAHRADICAFQADPVHALVFIGFNSLNLIDDKTKQKQAIASAARGLRPGGLLLVELLNPLQSSIMGSPYAGAMAMRTDPATGRRYVKFGLPTGMREEQKQVINGWYDVIEPDGSFRRLPFRMGFRFVFPHELELMFTLVGLETRIISGDHVGAPYVAGSRRIVGLARKPS